MKLLAIDRRTNFRNFGYNPVGRLLRDLYGKLFGHPNVMKRLQARDIMSALALHEEEFCIDVGCGGRGYFSVEFAKAAGKVIGFDILDSVLDIPIPPELRDKLEFQQVENEKLPLDDGVVDVVFASEVLTTVPNSQDFLREWRRVLKPDGRLVVCNSTGRPTIEEAYLTDSPQIRSLRSRYPTSFPSTYADYEVVLNRQFGNSRNNFLKLEELQSLLLEGGFIVEQVVQTPGKRVADHYYWRQFRRFLKDGDALARSNFLLEYWFYVIKGYGDLQKNAGGLVTVCRAGDG